MRKRKILIVDDERGVRQSIAAILENRFEVLVAEGPLEGLHSVRTERPDLVFCDIRMPMMSGLEVLRRIKESYPETEVAMITAYASLESAREALQYGALDYLLKPFGVNDILAVVDAACRKLAAREAQETQVSQLEQTTGDLAARLQEVAGEPAASPPLAMLVVYDRAILEAMEAFAASRGFAPDCCSRGHQAMARLSHHAATSPGYPKVLVTDLNLPDTMGTELARYAKNLNPAVHVIVLSGQPISVEHTATLDEVLMKPFELSELCSRVMLALGLDATGCDQ